MKKAIGTVMILLFMLFAAVTSGLANTKEQFCTTYADKAVAQYNLGKQHNLPGIVPPAWSNNRSGHFNWCMTAPENVATSESVMRQAYLEKYIHKNSKCRHVASGKEVKEVCIRIKNTSPYDYELLLVGEKFLGDLESGRVTEY